MGRGVASAIRAFVYARPRLNEARRLIRFVQAIPRQDLVTDRMKVAAALRLRPFTLLDYPRLSNLYELARECPSGAIVECGVCGGGSAALLADSSPAREFWLFDSWEGLPEPSTVDVAVGGKRREKGWNFAEEENVRALFARRPNVRVHLVKGWFEETLPRTDTGPIALLHVDCDWYDSVRFVLESLYDLVVPGGFVVIDDYNHWLGAKRAVDEFIADRDMELEYVGAARDNAVYWRAG
jgi:O-methyltransferase